MAKGRKTSNKSIKKQNILRVALLLDPCPAPNGPVSFLFRVGRCKKGDDDDRCFFGIIVMLVWRVVVLHLQHIEEAVVLRLVDVESPLLAADDVEVVHGVEHGPADVKNPQFRCNHGRNDSFGRAPPPNGTLP